MVIPLKWCSVPDESNPDATHQLHGRVVGALTGIRTARHERAGTVPARSSTSLSPRTGPGPSACDDPRSEVRPGYDDFAQPGRLITELAIPPVGALAARGGRVARLLRSCGSGARVPQLLRGRRAASAGLVLHSREVAVVARDYRNF